MASSSNFHSRFKALAEIAVLALLSGLALWGALQVPKAPEGETWAGVVPFAAALALAVIALLMLASQIGSAVAEQRHSGINSSVWWLFALALLYQASLSSFGYLLPTALVAPLALALFGVRSPLGLGLSMLLCPLGFHLIFFVALGVYPPYGEVFDLADWLGR